jgi:hypothetical protein
MESALIAQDRALSSRMKAASSPSAARRIRTRIVLVICAAALLGFLLVLLLNSYACRKGNNTLNGPNPKTLPADRLSFNQTNKHTWDSFHLKGEMRNSGAADCVCSFG